MQLIEVQVFIYLFTVFIFNSKPLFVCAEDRVCLKVAIPAYCFNIFGSIFFLRIAHWYGLILFR